MELFIAVILFGVIVYELVTGNIPIRYGSSVSRRRSVSRSEKPVQYWLWVLLQAAFAFLFAFGIIKL